MSYLVLARKYRPGTFDTVAGQEHVTRTLKNAVTRDQIAHAYLFAGPRGVGKTSIARIFAKALNCEQGLTAQPDGDCLICREIAEGSSLGVREIDGASHNSVDNVRELIESFRSLPPPNYRYKVYIIDEVHMLSTAAFNALLKSLEEPPPNTVFILATTEPHKIPETVISRCQRHDFRALSSALIFENLKSISQSENIDAEDEVLRMIARLSDGSMRDAQSLLDRVHAFCEGRITAADSSQALGAVEKEVLFGLSKAIMSGEASQSLQCIQSTFEAGVDPAIFLREFVRHFREILVAKFGGAKALQEFGIPEDEVSDLLSAVESLSNQDVQDLVHLARVGADNAIRSSYPKYALESLVVRMATREPVKDLGEILLKMRQLVSKEIKQKRALVAEPAQKKSVARRSSHKVEATLAKREEVSEPAEAPQERALSWKEFVDFVVQSGALVVAEHLRRLSVTSFQAGALEARGPEFSMNSLLEKANHEKLHSLLKKYSQIPSWRIKITNGESAGSPEPGSLLEKMESQEKVRREQRKKELLEHPKVQNIQKVFPGSKVESIRIKDETS